MSSFVPFSRLELAPCASLMPSIAATMMRARSTGWALTASRSISLCAAASASVRDNRLRSFFRASSVMSLAKAMLASNNSFDICAAARKWSEASALKGCDGHFHAAENAALAGERRLDLNHCPRVCAHGAGPKQLFLAVED